ncbi:putative secreted protein (Por secretion system target) [Mariniflexile fucanivorans]|uniref:Putative secreted protein (Por secretion system target) n=1 Tax=Mariniflexile fucanivorans TaxID=264023 RepID=A0A4R1RHA9_9FLAO|nr:CotH kinase family protein [Mariniflexile fucanivorans]TCL65455.1 putative secreted protein (Por secretion system target) [Mariniflexile fucanivorans]
MRHYKETKVTSKIRLLKKTFTLIFTLLLTNIINANDIIQINQNQYFIDINKGIVITNMDVTTINSTWPNSKTHILLNELCEFTIPPVNIEIGTVYTIHIPSQNSNFALYFSELPIISIFSDNTIVDDPNVLAYFKMIETNQNFLESNIGIQYRGGWSQSLAKKSMEIEFWTDSTGAETEDYNLLGMANNDDWNLQAMYNEPLRIRSKTNNDLWRKINTLHYQNQEPEAINGIRMKYIELFLNNEYRGVYCLGEKVSRKQLKLKKHNGIIRGELYKGVSWGASTFTSIPTYNNNLLAWSGFEYKHPDEEVDWSNLHGLVDFIINSSNGNFFDEYKDRFEIDNLVDYYIFLNLLRATDNTGKNIYIAKYNTNDNYFYVPWDLDGSFGTIWNGTNDNTTNDLLSNGFYNRLIYDCSPNGFKERLKNKWLLLRSTVITHDSLMSLFTSNHDYLKVNGIYDRENLAWTSYTYNNTDLNYMSAWITNRLIYLDVKLTENCIPLSINQSTFNNELIKIHPNPTDDLIFINTEFLHDYKVSVYNYLGQVVQHELISKSNNTISLGNLNSGIYFIKLENKEHTEIRKIILSK